MQLENILSFVGGVIAILLPLLFSKKKVSAETGTVEVQSAREVIAEWKSLVDEFKADINNLETTNNKLLSDNIKLKEMYDNVFKELHQLRLAYSKLERNYQELKKSFNN